MSDQAAAEALVSVGRSAQGQDRSGGEDSDEEDIDTRTRKRARRSMPGPSGGDRSGDVDLDMGDERREGRFDRGDGQAGVWGERGVQDSPNVFGGFSTDQRSVGYEGGSDPRYAVQRSYGPGIQSSSSSYDLPSIHAALGGDKGGSRYGISGSSRDTSQFVGPGTAPSAFPRPDTSLSRTVSPVSHQHHQASPNIAAGPATSYHLPPPHGMAQAHASYFPGGTSTSTNTQVRQSSPRAPSPARTHLSSMSGRDSAQGGQLPVPSISELERHYFELSEQRRKFQEMIERTDQLMVGIQRGIEDMRAGGGAIGSVGQPNMTGTVRAAGNGNGHSSAASVPLASRNDRGRSEGQNVWNVIPGDGSNRD